MICRAEYCLRGSLWNTHSLQNHYSRKPIMALSFSTVITFSLTPALVCDQDLIIRDFNALFEEVSGYGKEAKNHLSLTDIYQGHDLHKLVSKLTPDNVYFSHFEFLDKAEILHTSSANMVLDDTGRILVTFQVLDADGRDKLDQNFQACHDPLTSLPNRILLGKRIDAAIRESREKLCYAAVLFVDLDEFKPINDTYGHKCGDHVLIKTSERMLNLVRQHDTVARIGGDEFVLVCKEMKEPVHAGLTAKRLLRAITRPVEWQEHLVGVSASVGISIIPDDGTSADELLHKADEAMYLAKKSGKNGYSFFDEENYFL
jgi:diguanylate cyclase (GGDEF)-like protein